MAKQKVVENDANLGDPSKHLAENAEKQTKTRVKKERAKSMISVWGETFHRAATENLDQSQVEQIMIDLYPAKEPSIRKWTGWYKNYYNMGKIKGFENPVKVMWASPKSAAAEEKRAARAAASAEKKAAKEQAKAEKAAEKARRKEDKQPA